MKNAKLLSVVAFSALILPAIASAGLVNERIDLAGILSVPGKDSIKLELRGGRSISLNKGFMEIRTEKVPLGFSMLDPRLIIKQNGQTMAIDVPSSNYHNDENFTLSAKDSDLNYDLYLRKTVTKGKSVERVEQVICTYKVYDYKCGLDMEAKYNCVQGFVDRHGVTRAKNVYVDSTTTYKLTLGKNSVLQAEFVSNKVKSERVSSEELEQCK